MLLLRRFDRGENLRRQVITARTFNPTARHRASYPGIVDALSRHGAGEKVGGAVFDRALFNLVISNHDDHFQNHAAFWDGERLSLTPAFDLTPQEGSNPVQATALNREGARRLTIDQLVRAAAEYRLTTSEAQSRADHIIEAVESHWGAAAEVGELTQQQKRFLRRKINALRRV